MSEVLGWFSLSLDFHKCWRQNIGKINVYVLLLSVKIWYHFCQYLRTHTYWSCHGDSRLGEETFPVLFVICFAKLGLYEHTLLEFYCYRTATPWVFNSHFRVLVRYGGLLHFDIVCVCMHLNLIMSRCYEEFTHVYNSLVSRPAFSNFYPSKSKASGTGMKHLLKIMRKQNFIFKESTSKCWCEWQLGIRQLCRCTDSECNRHHNDGNPIMFIISFVLLKVCQIIGNGIPRR